MTPTNTTRTVLRSIFLLPVMPVMLLLPSSPSVANDAPDNDVVAPVKSEPEVSTESAPAAPTESAVMVPADLDTMNTATVAETLATLKTDPARTFAEHGGWLIGEKRINGGSELWSFTPEGHDAYPAAVQRLITDGDEGLAIEMNIQCDATPEACKSLDVLFSVMNENLIAVSQEAPPIREPDAK